MREMAKGADGISRVGRETNASSAGSSGNDDIKIKALGDQDWR